MTLDFIIVLKTRKQWGNAFKNPKNSIFNLKFYTLPRYFQACKVRKFVFLAPFLRKLVDEEFH